MPTVRSRRFGRISSSPSTRPSSRCTVRRDDETFETLRFGSGERVTLECPATSFAVDELYRDLSA